MSSLLLLLTLPSSLVVPGDVLTTRDYYTQSRQPPVPLVTTKLGWWSSFGFQCRYQVVSWQRKYSVPLMTTKLASRQRSVLSVPVQHVEFHDVGTGSWNCSSICWLSCDICESIITYSCIACGYNNEGPFRDWYSVHHANHNLTLLCTYWIVFGQH